MDRYGLPGRGIMPFSPFGDSDPRPAPKSRG
jgi:hypothetical protein